MIETMRKGIFETERWKRAAAVVFWAAPVTIGSKIVIEDHQRRFLGDKVIVAMSGVLKETCKRLSAVQTWANYEPFVHLHSPSWPQDPSKNLMLLQSIEFGTGVDAEYMIGSMKQLLRLDLEGQIDGEVMLSWPSSMDATQTALRWLELYAPDNWSVYTPYEYVTEADGVRALATIWPDWRDVWTMANCSDVGLAWQVSVLDAYVGNLDAGRDHDTALRNAWGIARSELQSRSKVEESVRAIDV